MKLYKCSLQIHLGLTNVVSALMLCRSVCAHPENPAGGAWGGSALSQPAHPDQAMSHKALLYVAAEWLVPVHYRGMTCTVNARLEGTIFYLYVMLSCTYPTYTMSKKLRFLVFLLISFSLHHFFQIFAGWNTSHWAATFLKGTLWSFWPLVALWSNAFMSGSPFSLRVLAGTRACGPRHANFCHWFHTSSLTYRWR